jgi:hypothetical protein
MGDPPKYVRAKRVDAMWQWLVKIDNPGQQQYGRCPQKVLIDISLAPDLPRVCRFPRLSFESFSSDLGLSPQ